MTQITLQLVTQYECVEYAERETTSAIAFIGGVIADMKLCRSLEAVVCYISSSPFEVDLM